MLPLQMALPTWMWTIRDVVGIIIVLGIWSLPLWKDNPWYRVVEAIYLGGAFGNAAVVTYNAIISRAIVPLQKGVYLTIIPVLGGIIFYTLYSAKYRWLSRWPLAIMTACGAAQLMRSTFVSSAINRPINFISRFTDVSTPYLAFTAFACALAFATTTLYFVFTIKYNAKPLKWSRRIGRSFIIVYYSMQLIGSFWGYGSRTPFVFLWILRFLGLLK